MLQTQNTTPFATELTAMPDPDGVDTVYLTIRGTFRMGPSGVSLAEEQAPPLGADEYFGDPGASSLRRAGELGPSKPATDVVLIGHAHPTTAASTEQMDVVLAIGRRRKVVRVFGDRVWEKGLFGVSISQPRPFETMPLVYERAFGGVDRLGQEQVLAEERNPVGVGFSGKRKAKELVDTPLPNLEDPDELLERPGDRVRPAGFGFIAPSWTPRRTLAGTYDATWRRTRAPFLPEDFDPRFLNAAPPDLVFDPFLRGGEHVEIIGASPRGSLRFALPRARFDLRFTVEGRTEPAHPELETVVIEPDEDRLSLVWRAQVRSDKKTLQVDASVALESLTIDGEDSR